eukprot:SAG11_NODE_5480_length_1549_cov_3.828276_2_plen_68_part_00
MIGNPLASGIDGVGERTESKSASSVATALKCGNMEAMVTGLDERQLTAWHTEVEHALLVRETEGGGA